MGRPGILISCMLVVAILTICGALVDGQISMPSEQLVSGWSWVNPLTLIKMIFWNYDWLTGWYQYFAWFLRIISGFFSALGTYTLISLARGVSP